MGRPEVEHAEHEQHGQLDQGSPRRRHDHDGAPPHAHPDRRDRRGPVQRRAGHERDAAERWVFSRESGEPLGPNGTTHERRKAVKAAKARHTALHGLRHAHATILLTAGVPVHIVSKRLSHFTPPVITMTTYAHRLPRAQEAAVAVSAGMGSRRSS